MSKKSINISKLKNLGFSDNDLVELDKLSKQFEEQDLYKKIGKKNKEVIGAEIKPAKLTYDNILKRMEVDKTLTPDKILGEYRTDKDLIEKGTTASAEVQFDDISNSLNNYGVFATADTIRQMYEINKDDYDLVVDILIELSKYDTKVPFDVEESGRIVINRELIEELQSIVSMYYNIDEETGEII